MPKKIDPELRSRAVRLVNDHLGEYQNVTAASVAVAKQLGVSRESLRRWVAQGEVDSGPRPGGHLGRVGGDQASEGREPSAAPGRGDLEGGDVFLRGGTRPPQPLIMGFIDAMRAEGHAVESVCRVLREQGCQVTARTYRAWKNPRRRLTTRTFSDAQVTDAVRDAAWDLDAQGRRRLTPEGLYGRRKMTAHLRRSAVPDASPGSVDRAMRALGLVGVRRDKGTRTTIPTKDGIRTGDLLNRQFRMVGKIVRLA